MILQNSKANPAVTNSDKLPSKYSHLIFLLLYVILVCKTMSACYRIDDFNYIHISMLFLLGVILYKLCSILTSKTSIKSAWYLFLLPIMLLLYIMNSDALVSIWDTYIVQNFNSINQGIYYESETYYHQFFPFLIILIPVTTAVCYTFSKNGAAELSILIMSIYMFSFWNNGLDRLMAKYVPFYILISLSLYSISKYDKITCKFKSTAAKISVSFRNIILYTLFLSVLITLSSFAASHSFGTKSIFQLKSDYAAKETSLMHLGKKSAFDLTFTGYGSDNGKLGGPIQTDTLIALKVKSDHPVYLRGSVKDHYNGQDWSNGSDNYVVKGMEPLIVPNKDYNFRITGDISTKPDIEKMSIYNYGIETSTLFSPNNTISINSKEGKIMYDASHTFMLIGNNTGNDSYTLKYYSSITGIENFKKAKHSISYETDTRDTAKIEYYKNNILQHYKKYLQVPQSITPRTYELVDSITRDCMTTGEKVEKIMNYLSVGFPYSLEVSQIPDETDFIDYFLFSERKGYCTYFATTAAIMCRIAGIPARYVEGFNMDEEKDSNGLYIVRNYRSHAWAEILVSPQSDLWCIVDCVPQGAPINEISNSSQYRDKFADDRYKYGDSRFAGSELYNYKNDNVQDYASLLSILLYPLFIIPAAALLLLTLYIIYRLIKFKRAAAKLLAAESMIPLYKHLTTRLKSIGEDFPEERCDLEHVRSLKDKKLSECLEKIVTACYAEHYGNIDNHKALDKKSCYSLIERYIRKKQGLLKYWYFRVRYPQGKKKIL